MNVLLDHMLHDLVVKVFKCGHMSSMWQLHWIIPIFFSLQLFPCSAIECSCCLWGIDLSVGGALPSMEKKLSSYTALCVFSGVFLLCSPSAEEPSDVPIISNKTAIAHQRQVKSSFIPLHRHCLPTRPNAYCATRRFPGISLVVFPRKIAIKKGGRKAEIGIVVDQYVPPAELSSHTVRAFTDLGPKGNPGEIPTWTWTACKEEGLEGEERRRKQRSESESYMCLFFSIFNTSSFTFFFFLFCFQPRAVFLMLQCIEPPADTAILRWIWDYKRF